ncbi:3-hydroxyisobutyrate dehydrogenase protein [Colletotrichum tofieldiae]|uniref:3-hydroxyisobutyrate dehydrogenase protein n=1 Tax=Colletotrichum tofieldiae TaxID=708197 RepID=A0A166SGA8_9PEZI|nr:3-hydroxyisobutyrate dehydrogenase protein [Colletotrichum tofieldiae]
MVTPWNAILKGLTSSSRFVLGRLFDVHTWYTYIQSWHSVAYGYSTEADRHLARLLYPGQEHDAGRGPVSLDRVGTISSEQPYTDNIRLSGALPLSSDARRAGSSPISLRPRYLCFVKDFDEGIYETVKVSDYLEQHGDDIDLEFVFVSYTRIQFRVATEEEINKHKYPDEATREANREIARRDRRTLAQWGIDAAKRVGKRAFWLDFECVRNDDGVARSTSSSEDVYRICDIVRAAHSMIIAIGPPASDKVAALIDGRETPAYRREEVTPWLRQWGSRLWTLPELLLCPAEYRINLYVLGDPTEPKAMAKRNFAERAWEDAEAVKELVDHFEGSAILTELRLIEAALSCFSRRQTDQFSQGDIAYATMGFFPNRHRPQVNKEDSGFQAFAKLSLANDSGAFLSRLICLAPRQGASWHQTEDRWGVKLSDIYPSCNVSGVVGSEAIMLDRVHGATIHWDRIDPEPLFGQNARFVFPWLLASHLVCFAIPMVSLAMIYLLTFVGSAVGSRFPKEGRVFFATICMWAIPAVGLVAVLSAMVVIGSRCQPKPPLKSRLLGLEGIVAAGRISEYLWGFDHGDLMTVIPQPYSDTENLGQPLTPLLPSTRQEEHGFTLVDTKIMTITHFYCNKPPVAMFVCGSENGVQRTLLCSYNWRTQTFHRQTVLRVARRGLDKLHLIDGVRFSLAAHPDTKVGSPENTSNSNSGRPTSLFDDESREVQIGNPTQLFSSSKDLCRTWKSELLFLAICFVGLNTMGPYYSYNFVELLSCYMSFITGLMSATVLLYYLPLNQAAMYTFAASVHAILVPDE